MTWYTKRTSTNRHRLPPHPLTARELLLAVEKSVSSMPHANTDDWRRAHSLCATLRSLADCTPPRTCGWDAYTYFLLAGGRPNGMPDDVYAARAAALDTCLEAAEDETAARQERDADGIIRPVRIVDAPGASLLIGAWRIHLDTQTGDFEVARTISWTRMMLGSDQYFIDAMVRRNELVSRSGIVKLTPYPLEGSP